ncbi:hypothetical protein BASA50_007812 [Batrachochytrium salamandrivorans]|uniref:Protein OS-9 homolog n=1 Tax=Batrachochytrium salamandrivorans TaxID=1357716 RepID=A0ABQ8F8Q1_9FUNG|nr:hypothetical protein BASA60_007607 [Batrachochytrium salamandrivorans]KAH6573297.1 hypothetical protein BASA62_003024 [Batrachochytrium salamandrivorans]KAH6592762.1 hypothetical protein BASA50_007812 [Batrachochytrium salamandrivorans]KAH9269235.1 hypothetical protein BASA83_008727 [Batrachochytrium salamandrivorans]
MTWMRLSWPRQAGVALLWLLCSLACAETPDADTAAAGSSSGSSSTTAATSGEAAAFAAIGVDMFAKPDYRMVFSLDWINANQLKDLEQQDGMSLMMMTRSVASNVDMSFACLIPNPPSLLAIPPLVASTALNNEDTATQAQKGTSEQSDSAHAVDNVLFRREALLAAQKLLRSIKCLYHVPGGYWTYELCMGGKIRQFYHTAETTEDRKKKPPGSTPTEYILGRSGNIKSEDVVLQTDLSGSAWVLKETWGGGTMCDLTGVPRETIIEYHCSQVSEDTITSLREVSSCRYLIVIKTFKLCRNSIFVRQRAKSAPAIECRPVQPTLDELSDPKGDANVPTSETTLKKTSINRPRMNLQQVLNYERDSGNSPFADQSTTESDSHDGSQPASPNSDKRAKSGVDSESPLVSETEADTEGSKYRVNVKGHLDLGADFLDSFQKPQQQQNQQTGDHREGVNDDKSTDADDENDDNISESIREFIRSVASKMDLDESTLESVLESIDSLGQFDSIENDDGSDSDSDDDQGAGDDGQQRHHEIDFKAFPKLFKLLDIIKVSSQEDDADADNIWNIERDETDDTGNRVGTAQTHHSDAKKTQSEKSASSNTDEIKSEQRRPPSDQSEDSKDSQDNLDQQQKGAN